MVCSIVLITFKDCNEIFYNPYLNFYFGDGKPGVLTLSLSKQREEGHFHR